MSETVKLNPMVPGLPGLTRQVNVIVARKGGVVELEMPGIFPGTFQVIGLSPDEAQLFGLALIRAGDDRAAGEEGGA